MDAASTLNCKVGVTIVYMGLPVGDNHIKLSILELCGMMNQRKNVNLKMSKPFDG